MSYQTFIQIAVFIVVIFMICGIYYSIMIKQVEGMTNRLNKTNTTTSHGTQAENFSNQLKNTHNLMKDKLNVSNYRTDYENVVIEMNDYVHGMMLDELLSVDPANVNPTTISKKLENINKLAEGKNNLNHVMKYLDAN